MTVLKSINLCMASNLPRRLSLRFNPRKCQFIVCMAGMINMFLVLGIWKYTHDDNEIVKLSDLGERPVCETQNTYHLNNATIALDQEPFKNYVRLMKCKANENVAIFGESMSTKFVAFRNTMVDPALANIPLSVSDRRRGGERPEDVWLKPGVHEHISLKMGGYFVVPCVNIPRLRLGLNWKDRSTHPFFEWAETGIKCFGRFTGPSKAVVVKDYTLAIKRYEYTNLYNTMCEYYNAFVLMLLFGVRPSNLNILFVDLHPAGSLDSVWETLFGRVLRAGRLDNPVLFHNLIWGMPEIFSPLNDHNRKAVPYLENFRDFFLTQHNVRTDHAKDCEALNVVFIWRPDHTAHPRRIRERHVTRKFANQKKMLRVAQQLLGANANVRGYQLDTMTMPAQLEVIANCDILIGMHGTGLSHIMFLPKTSAVLEFESEIVPDKMDFYALAIWRGVPYIVGDVWHSKANINMETYVSRVKLSINLDTIRSRICVAKRKMTATEEAYDEEE